MLGILFSQKSTLGVLSPWEPMNMSNQLDKDLLRGGKADQEEASHPGLAQFGSTSPVPDLRGQLNKKWSADQVTPHYRYGRIFTSVLDDCTCSSPAQTKSVFERISANSSA